MRRPIDKVFAAGDGSRICSGLQCRSGPIIFLIPGNLDKNVETQYQDYDERNSNEEDLLEHDRSF